MTGNQKKVALVIGAGSVKCAAALGMWKVLKREGIEVDMFVGCSGGSLYAALMALGRDLDDCERMTMQLWTPALTRKADFRSMLSAALPKLFGFKGHFAMVDDEPMMTALKIPFGDSTFDQTGSPLHIVAADLLDGSKVVLNNGKIIDAIRASVALPYIWKPWKVNGRELVDGCLADPLPIDVAIREGAEVILAMGFQSPYPKRIRSATRYAFQINSIYTNNLLQANYAFHNLAHHAEIIPVIPDFNQPIRLFDSEKIPYVIEEGVRTTEQQLPHLKNALQAAGG